MEKMDYTMFSTKFPDFVEQRINLVAHGVVTSYYFDIFQIIRSNHNNRQIYKIIYNDTEYECNDPKLINYLNRYFQEYDEKVFVFEKQKDRLLKTVNEAIIDEQRPIVLRSPMLSRTTVIQQINEFLNKYEIQPLSKETSLKQLSDILPHLMAIEYV